MRLGAAWPSGSSGTAASLAGPDAARTEAAGPRGVRACTAGPAQPGFDTTHVRPNHWKRGALIGFVATAWPVARSAEVGGCGGWGSWAITKAAIPVSVGALGGLVGGLVGSFFPKGETKAIGN
jgi:hypothetical protein